MKVLGIVALGIVCLFLLIDSYIRYQCSNYESVTGKEVKYMAFDTCYINHNGVFMRWDEYKLYITVNGINK